MKKYLKRKIDAYLEEWKSNVDHKPLLIKGPRQVGKTCSILEFGHSHYKSVIYLNFNENSQLRTILVDGYNPNNIIRNITRVDSSLVAQFLPHETLIVFDEIQLLPDILTSAKFFKLDGNYDVIFSGSLLGISLGNVTSYPVGYISEYELYSLDFEEFLWALGYEDDIVDEIFSCMVQLKPISQVTFRVLTDKFNIYCIIGGMPEVVLDFVENNIFSNTLKLQKEIIDDHRQDMVKYAYVLDQKKILAVYNSLPAQLAKENKKFQPSKVDIKSKGHIRDYFDCIQWLVDVGVVRQCYNLAALKIPLKGYVNTSEYKIYFSDSGLLLASLDNTDINNFYQNFDFGIWNGGFYENIVAEALFKSQCDLYYFKRKDSTLEEEFILRTIKNIVPLEVKTSNSKSKSLNELIKNNDKYPLVKYGIKLTNTNIGFNGTVITFPHFCAFLVRRFLEYIDNKEIPTK